VKKRMIWSNETDAIAAAMRANGASNAKIGERFGVSAKSVASRFCYVGMLRSIDMAERRRVMDIKESSAHTEALILTELAAQRKACERHAEAVMAQGGFCALSERSLGSGKWAVCLPLIWPARAA
jgi:hypothetical protein